MINTKKLSILLLAIFIFFILATSISYGAGIVPCGNSENDTPCTTCHLIKGISNLVNYGKNILIGVAIVGIVIAGIIYMMSSGSESMITTAKNCFKASLVGFAITIAAWLIVNTVLFWILPAKSNLGVGVIWYSFDCDTTSSATNSDGTTTTSTEDTANSNETDCRKECQSSGKSGTELTSCYNDCASQAQDAKDTTGNKLTQSEAQSKLDGCGVKYASGKTLNNIQDSTVSELCSLKSSSNCTPTVTTNGGTTGSHASGTCSHSTGCKADLRLDSCVGSYVEKTYSKTGTRSDGAACYSASNGACYAKEGDHWDISVKRSCKEQGC
ncbi:MAG TPA: pilin [Patescibacteria group bacterium]|nr:pilin [Patescibacteria group bacterium]